MLWHFGIDYIVKLVVFFLCIFVEYYATICMVNKRFSTYHEL